MDKVNKFQNAVFIVTQEHTCPFYSLGDEITVAECGLSVSSYKSCCLYLSQTICEIVAARDVGRSFSERGRKTKGGQYQCPGCDGKIHFEYKREKQYATLQMKLLNDTEERQKKEHLAKFFSQLRRLKIFAPLDDDALAKLILLLEMKNYTGGRVVVKKGEPGSYLYIVLEGKVTAVGDDGARIAEMGPGEIFGEMSMLSGEPVSCPVYTIAPTRLALLSLKNFKYVIAKYPVLQIFLFRMLVDRAQAMTLRSGDITSGMTGELEEIAVVDLFQLINSSKKTGSVKLLLEQGKGMVFFSEGEVVHAQFAHFRDKEAIFALLEAKEGRFVYGKGIPRELHGRPPLGDFMGMLMEGLQKIDEQQEISTDAQDI